MEKADLVLFEQVQDAVVVLLDHGVLARHHLGRIHAQALDRDAMVGKVVAGLLKMLARLQ